MTRCHITIQFFLLPCFFSASFRFVSFFSHTHTPGAYFARSLQIYRTMYYSRALVYGLCYIISLTHRDLSAQKIPPRAHNLTFTFLIVPAINGTAIASSSSQSSLYYVANSTIFGTSVLCACIHCFSRCVAEVWLGSFLSFFLCFLA